MKRAAIYARVSSERQAAEDRVSIESQLGDCERHCQQRGYQIEARYVDKEKYRVRGKLVQPSAQRKDRPQYVAMLTAARAGEFEVIVAWKEDRLYRGMFAAMPFAEMLDEMGKRLDVELVRESFDRKMLGMKAAVGKLEVDNIRERMIMGRAARLERGEAAGGNIIYGCRKDEQKRLAIHESEAAIVRQIFAWYTAGENVMQIRRRLTALDVRTRSGSRWSKSVICRILGTESYATGKITTTLDGKTYTTPCPPIISLDTWRQVCEVHARNRKIPRHVVGDYLCAGLVVCACGNRSHPANNYGNMAKGYQPSKDYRCTRRLYTEPDELPPQCHRKTSSKKVDKRVWEFVKEICSNPDVLRAAIAQKLEEVNRETEDLEAEMSRLQNQLDKLTNERQWVITQARKGGITEADMELQLAALQLQEWAYTRELGEKQAASEARARAESMSNWAAKYLADIGAGIQALDVDLTTATEEYKQTLFVELDAARFEARYPNDAAAQLRWAVIEEKRRIIRTLVSKVIIARTPEGRSIDPVLAMDIPVLVADDQSPDYKPEPEK